MIIGFGISPSRVKASAGVSYDADAQAFFTAASITDSTQKSAVNQLVLDLKSYNIWTKMKAIYPIVGGTSSTHKWNLKDPRDLDAAFRLTFATGVTHSSTGMKGDGASGYANTYFNDSTSLALNSGHISIYSRTNKDALMCDIGLANNTSDSSIFSKYTNSFYPRMHALNNGIINNLTSAGFFVSNRISSSEIRGWQNGVIKIISNGSVDTINQGYIIGALNRLAANQNDITFYSDRQYAFASIGDGLTDTEAANFYTAVQAYQTTLSRNV